MAHDGEEEEHFQPVDEDEDGEEDVEAGEGEIGESPQKGVGEEGDRVESIREIDLHEQTGIAEMKETGIFLGRLEEAKRLSELADYFGAGWGRLSALPEAEEVRLPGAPVRHGFVGEPIREAGLAEARRRRVGAEMRSWLSLGWWVTVTGINEGEVARLEEWLQECDLSERDVAGLDFRISRLGQGFAWPEGKWVLS